MATSTLIESVAHTTSLRDRDDLNHAIARLLQQFLDAELVAIYNLVDDVVITRVARRIAVTRGKREFGPDEIEELSTLPALDDVPAWRECALRREIVRYAMPNGFSHSIFPVEGEREVLGLLEVQTADELSPRDATLVAGILRIFKNHLALLDYGERDTLTGLRNRKTFDSSFEKLRQRLRITADTTPAAQPSWLGLLDIDRFKSINDSHGHLFGDEVLLLIGQLMQQTFRGADQLFRFGGEEFVIVLDHANAGGAQIAFERLRAKVEAHTFPQVGRVTISLGYTQIDSQDSPSSSVERADAALYYAKQHGRNRVCNYESLIKAGGLIAKKQNNVDIELF